MNGDYMQNGLLHCGKCRTPKQADIEGIGRVSVLCRCEKEQRRAEEERDRRQSAFTNAMRRAPQEVRIGAQSEHCDGRVKRWLEHWNEMQAQNIGLLLWGDVGTGKTASCAYVAQALESRYIPCLLTSLSRLASYDHGSVIPYLGLFDLLILDDLGAERQSSFMLEKTHEIIDERVNRKKPMLLTTNLTLGEMQQERDRDLKRIYDRIMSVCVPVQLRGQSHRKAQAAALLQAARKLMQG